MVQDQDGGCTRSAQVSPLIVVCRRETLLYGIKRVPVSTVPFDIYSELFKLKYNKIQKPLKLF